MIPYVLLSLIFGITFAVEKPCIDDSHCAGNECCQILSEFLVVSRRDLNNNNFVGSSKAGTCKPYRLEGDHCDVFGKANGYCSCGPGLTCKGEEIPYPTIHAPTLDVVTPEIPKPMGKRDMRPSKPGYYWEYTCTKI